MCGLSIIFSCMSVHLESRDERRLVSDGCGYGICSISNSLLPLSHPRALCTRFLTQSLTQLLTLSLSSSLSLSPHSMCLFRFVHLFVVSPPLHTTIYVSPYYSICFLILFHPSIHLVWLRCACTRVRLNVLLTTECVRLPLPTPVCACACILSFGNEA